MSGPTPPSSQSAPHPHASSNSATITATPATSLPVLAQLDNHILPALNRIEQIATRAVTLQSATRIASSRQQLSHCRRATDSRLSDVWLPVACCREQSALVPYSIAQAQADAHELLNLLASLPPLLQSSVLAHVTPALSAECGTAEQLNTALREAAAAKESLLLSSFPRAQQLAVDRLAQHNRQRQLTG